MAALPVVLAPALDVPPEQLRTVGLLVGLAWVPAITLVERARLHAPGPWTTTASLALDLGVLSAIAVLAPTLVPLVVVAAATTGALHGTLHRAAARLLVAALVVGCQILVGADPTLVLLVDVMAALLASTMVGAQEADRRRSRSELQHASQLTDAVLAGIGEAVVVTDAVGRVTSTNDAAHVTFGTTTGPCHAALGLRRGSEVLDCSTGCPLLGLGGTPAAEEVHREHADGRRQVLLANVRALRDPFGRMREVVHSFRDVSPLKRVEEARSLFLASTSHELKTPLTVIGGFAELLAGDRLDADQRRLAADTIATRTRELTDLVERLLLTSRLEAGAVTIEVGDVDVDAFIAASTTDLADALGRQVRTSLPVDLPLVRADRRAAETVLEHLVENACKYSAAIQPVDVRVSCDDHFVFVDVADRGRGMSREQALRCFDPFWRAEADDLTGSGVGLYVARSFARVMGGDVHVLASQPGSGTVMRLRLRRADVVPAPAPLPRAGTAGTSVDEFLRQTGAARVG